MRYPKLRMLLFFTQQVKLLDWYRQGLLTREIAIYQKLRDIYNVHTEFITYGGLSDARLARQVMDMPVHVNFLPISIARYERYLHWIHLPAIQRTDVIKTNQISGSDLALRASRKWKKPLITRFGYMHSLFQEEAFGKDSLQAQHAHKQETSAFRNAKAIICTSDRMKADIDRRFDNLPVYVIPNYVDTKRFRPHIVEKTVDITFVGRFHQQKNLMAMLEAISQLDVTCRLIGGGELQAEFEACFGDLDGRLTYYGQASHDDLPKLLSEARLFVLPSHYEGHPKSLIEAMSCGCAVLGTDVNGTREVIQQGQTGWLCDTSSDSLRHAIAYLLSDDDLLQKLGHNARQYVLDNYDLDRIAEKEYQVIRSVVDQSRKNES